MRLEPATAFKWLLALLLLVPALAGCSTPSVPYLNALRPLELESAEEPGGIKRTYSIDRTFSDRRIKVLARTERPVDRPDLGLDVTEIDKSMAKERQLDPYRGLFVSHVEDGGPAEKAGVMPGDVLMKVGGVELQYTEQFDHVLQKRLKLGKRTVLQVVRGRETQEKLKLDVMPRARRETEMGLETVTLDPPTVEGPSYVGILIGTLPAAWTEKIYGDKKDTVLIGGVYVGSPAYRGGLRTGDRVLSANGRHFESASALKAEILKWAAAGERVTFEVFHPRGGRHEARLRLSRYEIGTDVLVPLIYSYDGSADTTRWKLLPWGMLWGYEGKYRRSTSRDTNYTRVFWGFLGLIRHEWGPEKSRTRLLWFIRFGSK